jgi:HAD superfamily hydrolase (TIGR01549 family)
MKYITIDAQAVEVVADLKRQGLHLALISNMMLPGKLLTAKLREAKALAYFDQIAISSEVGFLKPHPEIFRQAVTRSRLRADEVLFVGDSYAQDILGAKRAGLQTAWLNPRHEPCPTTGDNQADYEIETLAELTEKPIAGR